MLPFIAFIVGTFGFKTSKISWWPRVGNLGLSFLRHPELSVRHGHAPCAKQRHNPCAHSITSLLLWWIEKAAVVKRLLKGVRAVGKMQTNGRDATAWPAADGTCSRKMQYGCCVLGGVPERWMLEIWASWVSGCCSFQPGSIAAAHFREEPSPAHHARGWRQVCSHSSWSVFECMWEAAQLRQALASQQCSTVEWVNLTVWVTCLLIFFRQRCFTKWEKHSKVSAYFVVSSKGWNSRHDAMPGPDNAIVEVFKVAQKYELTHSQTSFLVINLVCNTSFLTFISLFLDYLVTQ